MLGDGLPAAVPEARDLGPVHRSRNLAHRGFGLITGRGSRWLQWGRSGAETWHADGSWTDGETGSLVHRSSPLGDRRMDRRGGAHDRHRRRGGPPVRHRLQPPGTEAQHVVDLLGSQFKAQSGDVDTIVFHNAKGTVDDPAVRNAVTPLLARVAKMPHVVSVISPYSQAGAVEVSKDRATAFATVNYDKRANLLPDKTGQPVLDAINAVKVPGLQARRRRPGDRERRGLQHRPRHVGGRARRAHHPAAHVRLAERGWDAAVHRRPGPDHRHRARSASARTSPACPTSPRSWRS